MEEAKKPQEASYKFHYYPPIVIENETMTALNYETAIF
jgi:hypothetical protein